jgi:YD repeat-containing protein
MKIVCTLSALIFALSCNADPVLRKSFATEQKLQGKVKLVRYCYGGRESDINEEKTRPFDRSDYWVDSFSTTGLKLLSYHIYKGAAAERCEFKYDIKGNLIEQSNPMTSFTYDTKGKLIQQREYGADSSLGEWSRYIYVADKIIIKVDSIRTDEQVTLERTKYKYNDRSELIEETNLYDNGGEHTIAYKYDDKGNRISMIDVHNHDTATIKYDEHGNEILRVYHNVNDIDPVDGSIIKDQIAASEYIYDNHGNWIRRVTTNQDIMEFDNPLVIREIEYY